MPRILRIINRFNLGGPTYNAAYLTKYLAPEFETLLIGGRQDETEANSEYILKNLGIEAMTIPTMYRSINPVKDFKALNEIKNIIRDYKPDIVHTHASKAGALGRQAAYSLHVPVIVHTFHGHVFDSYFNGVMTAFYQSMERRLARKSTCIIALCDIQKFDLVEKYRICPAEKIEIVPLGFELERFHYEAPNKRALFRNEYLIDDDEIVIGIIGRIVPVKNHFLFLDAVKYLTQNTQKKIRAFIVGDGELKKAIKDKARSLGLDFTDFTTEKRKAVLSFTSWLKDIDYVTAGMDIIALSSLNEGTPVSLIEAQAAGKPIVSTNVGGVECAVMPGKTALLSDPQEPLEFAKNILILVENQDMRMEFSQQGWEFVYKKFHYTRLISDMKALYYRLLENNH